jgi:hypothetical protein
LKIRRKFPKPSAARPLYAIGYTFPAPPTDVLQRRYDREYGGPLQFTREPSKPQIAREGETFRVTHGPWHVHIRITLSAEESNEWKERLVWNHSRIGLVTTGSLTPANAADTILLAARLAREFTLLTDGTAYDVAAQAYLNPSDWKDLDLTSFHCDHHVRVVQAEGMRPEFDWFHTLGLSKFGLDEIELLQPLGLPDAPVTELLRELANELIRRGRSPKVGEVIECPFLSCAVRVVRHRTASPGGTLLILREIQPLL